MNNEKQIIKKLAKDTAQRYNENDRQHYYRITRKWLETSIKVVQPA